MVKKVERCLGEALAQAVMAAAKGNSQTSVPVAAVLWPDKDRQWEPAIGLIRPSMPNLLTLVAWDSCDHTAPVVEGDRLRSEVSVLEIRPAPIGTLLRLAVETWAARGSPEQETRVLDWKFWALGA